MVSRGLRYAASILFHPLARADLARGGVVEVVVDVLIVVENVEVVVVVVVMVVVGTHTATMNGCSQPMLTPVYES